MYNSILIFRIESCDIPVREVQEEVHVKDKEITAGVKPPEQVPVTTEKAAVEARPIIETKQESANKIVPRDPKENYKKYLEEARTKERLREERNRSIMAYILASLTFGGLVLILMLANHWASNPLTGVRHIHIYY